MDYRWGAGALGWVSCLTFGPSPKHAKPEILAESGRASAPVVSVERLGCVTLLFKRQAEINGSELFV